MELPQTAMFYVKDLKLASYWNNQNCFSLGLGCSPRQTNRNSLNDCTYADDKTHREFSFWQQNHISDLPSPELLTPMLMKTAWKKKNTHAGSNRRFSGTNLKPSKLTLVSINSPQEIQSILSPTVATSSSPVVPNGSSSTPTVSIEQGCLWWFLTR